ncbi:MAG: hypothetical protein AB1414_16315 [bacterium]
MKLLSEPVVIAIISFVAGIGAALIGFIAKYICDYRIEKRKLQLKERESVANFLGSSQSNFVRATKDFYTRLCNFFENPDKARKWLKPGETSASDGYYLREFVYRMFNFLVWGRIVQDRINALPPAETEECPDLQHTYMFVDLAYSIFSYIWLYKSFHQYDDSRESAHLFSGSMERIAECGIERSKSGIQAISREQFEKEYEDATSPIQSLRDFVVKAGHGNSPEISYVIGRLATLKAILASFLMDFSWTIKVPNKQEIMEQYQKDLSYAGTTSAETLNFASIVPSNLKELMERFRCKLLPV